MRWQDMQPLDLHDPWDLPPVLFLGTRDDLTFQRTNRGSVCRYLSEQEPFLELRGAGSEWQIAQLWQGHEVAVIRGRGRLGDLLKQYLAYSNNVAGVDPWEHWLKQKVEAGSCVQYRVPVAPTGVIVGVPDGRVVGLVTPVKPDQASALEALKGVLLRDLQTMSLTARGERQFVLETSSPPQPAKVAELVRSIAGLFGAPPGTWESAPRGQGRFEVTIRQQVTIACFDCPQHRLLALIQNLQQEMHLLRPGMPPFIWGGVSAGLLEMLQPCAVEVQAGPGALEFTPIRATFPPVPMDTMLHLYQAAR